MKLVMWYSQPWIRVDIAKTAWAVVVEVVMAEAAEAVALDCP